VKAQLQEAYGNVPFSFEANQGQTDRQVQFLSRGPGYTLFLTPTEAVLALQQGSKYPLAPDSGLRELKSAQLEENKTTVLRMQFEGANPSPRASGLEPLPGIVNYFIGNDPKKWRTNVPTYAKVKYRDVYPGVDLIYYGNQGQLEYDFVVRPGADPSAIKLAVGATRRVAQSGRGNASPLRMDANRDLVIQADGGEVRFHKPVVYQPTASGGRTPVDGRYSLKGSEVSFELASYNHSQPLVIDPTLVYSSYLGGSRTDGGSSSVSVAVDSSGNAYVAAGTNSVDFPVTAGVFQPEFAGALPTCNLYYPCGDAFVAKIDPTGSTLLYATYLGGSDNDYVFGLAVDASGNAFIAGETLSTDFPTTAGAFQTLNAGGKDVFVTELDPTGSALIYSTYLGGSGDDHPEALAIDASGNAYVSGNTVSANFPTTPGAFQTACAPFPGVPGSCSGDVFVANVNAAGTALVYSTYIGGSNSDVALGVAVDASRNAVVSGLTFSTDFPTTASAFQSRCKLDINSRCNGDAFVTKLNAAGTALIYSTYFGGSGTELANTTALDSSGNAYIVGVTDSTDLPVTPGAFQTTYGGSSSCSPNTLCFGGDAFVIKVNPSGAGQASLVYSTYLGGSDADGGAGIAVDASGNALASGQTCSSDFPTLNPVQGSLGGLCDAFVTALNPIGAGLVYSTYLGGSNGEFADFIAVDTSGSAYAGGWTESDNFPTTPGAFQPTFGGARDVFLAKIAAATANPTTKEQCKNEGWMVFGFKDQGQCVRFVETGKDSRIGE
jgi:hypothetical protein